jgi:hypothetical protein
MPTVLRIGPYRFMFFSVDKGEPPHIHVKRDSSQAKFWLSPVSLASNSGYAPHELNVVEKLVVKHHGLLLKKWHEYFGE